MTDHDELLIEERQIERLDKYLARTDVNNDAVCTTFEKLSDFVCADRFCDDHDLRIRREGASFLNCRHGLGDSIP